MLHVRDTEILLTRTPVHSVSLPLTAQMKFFIGTIATVIIAITYPRRLDTNMIFTFEHNSWAVGTIGKASSCWWGRHIFKLLEEATGFDKSTCYFSFSSFHYRLLFLTHAEVPWP